MSEPATRNATSDNQIGETFDLVKAYVRQETVGPLKGAGRWLGFGIGGALALGFGLSLLLLSLLRLLQTEAAETFDGNWSWAPYGITFVACALIGALAVSRIRKQTLQRKEPRR
ncbi:MAG: hypothetical protein AB7Q42_07590 [Acidimicrobiia bacterium]